VIAVTRLNDKELLVNPDLIEFVEETPDTVITLTTSRKLIVKEPADVLVDRIVTYRRKVFTQLPVCTKEEYI